MITPAQASHLRPPPFQNLRAWVLPPKPLKYLVSRSGLEPETY